jgi:hypothetical protein
MLDAPHIKEEDKASDFVYGACRSMDEATHRIDLDRQQFVFWHVFGQHFRQLEVSGTSTRHAQKK